MSELQLWGKGEYETARTMYLKVLQHLRSINSEISVARCLNNLGDVAMARGDYAGSVILCVVLEQLVFKRRLTTLSRCGESQAGQR